MQIPVKMPKKRLLRTVIIALVLMVMSLAGRRQMLAADSSEKVLWNFGASTDGSLPYGSLVADAQGNLYGATALGGSYGLGTVFKLTPPSGHVTQWTESVLYSFGATATDGKVPYSMMPLIMDKQGNLYGSTGYGGAYGEAICVYAGPPAWCGYGTIFKLTPPSGHETQWTESVLHSFGATATDGQTPVAGLIMDGGGALYGTTFFGGAEANAYGTIFKLTPPSGHQAQWTESVLWSFGAAGDGAFPEGGVIMDASGILYSTTLNGGVYGFGAVFKLTPPSDHQTQWSESLLYSFGATVTDGNYPIGGLIVDAHGNFYSTTYAGGAYACGTVFKLTPPSGHQTQWSESALWSFGAGSDGSFPEGGVIMDASGNLYGTTVYGGADAGGTVFKLMPPSGHVTQWSESLLYSFGVTATDGEYPVGGVTMDRSGNLYGTTSSGGANYTIPMGGNDWGGTVFKIVP